MQVKIGISFHCAEKTYFEINRLYAYIKQIICKGIYQKLHNSNRNTFSFIPPVCYFSCHPSIAASEVWSLKNSSLPK